MMDGKCFIGEFVTVTREECFISPFRPSTELWSISALRECRGGGPAPREGAAPREGPPGERDHGPAGDACALAAVWSAGDRDDRY